MSWINEFIRSAKQAFKASSVVGGVYYEGGDPNLPDGNDQCVPVRMNAYRAFHVVPAIAGNEVTTGAPMPVSLYAKSGISKIELEGDATNGLEVDVTRMFSGTRSANLNFTSPSSASTVAQTAITDTGKYNSLQVYAELTGATGGTLDIYIQTTLDGGTTFVDYAHFAQIAAGAGVILRTWAVTSRAQQTTITTVGKGTSPALAAATIVGGRWGDQMRVVAVAGAGTSAGAAQVIQLFFSA